MHKFLRAIGFSDVKTYEQLQAIIEKTIRESTYSKFCVYSDDVLYGDYNLEFSKNMGIAVCGQFSMDDEFKVDYYYPYYIGENVSTHERSVVERHSANVSFAGLCEDNRIGISIIYYLLNRIDYIKNYYAGEKDLKRIPVRLSGLSDSATIMMPLQKNENSKKNLSLKSKKRDKLIEAARQGSEEAIESLTLDDIDVYSTISQKIKETDVYSIVDTYFMPCGVECDLYSVLGEIMSLEEIENPLTKEHVLKMTLLCNGVSIDVCINKSDLFGEPLVGRRFKGTVWLQGYLDWLS